jgi:hypothetical protein
MKRIVNIILCAMFATNIMSQTAEVVEIQLLSPPENKVNFGDADKGVAIVAIHYYNMQSENISLDSMLINTVADGIKEKFEDSPMFENINIPVYNLYSDESMLNADMPLEELNAIAEQTGVNAVIAIEFVDIQANYVYGNSKQTLFSKAQQVPLLTNIDFVAKINIYDVRTGEKIMKFTGKDNVVIPSYSDEGNLIPALKIDDARKITAEMIGVDFAKRITPTWETAERMIFFDSYFDKSNNDLNRAYNAATKENDWSSAAQHWTNALNENSTKLRQAQTMYNLALACEMLEKFDLALKWLEHAKTLRTRIYESIDEYMNIIKQRIADKEKLDAMFF